MCGRFVRSRKRKEYARALGIPVEDVPESEEDWRPLYNVCPGTPVDVIRAGPGRPPAFARLWWGLLPYWSKNPNGTRRPINARAETAARKPSFRKLLEWRRCLVPADGYYEWQTTPAGKVPYFFRPAQGEPVFFAGLWDRWQAEGAEPIESFTLFTTTPNKIAGRIHDRMPVIVQPRDYGLWLDPAVRSAGEVAHVLAPAPDGALVGYPVSRAVSDPALEGERLIEPIGPELSESDAVPVFGQLI